jgi:hypothetical protein
MVVDLGFLKNQSTNISYLKLLAIPQSGDFFSQKDLATVMVFPFFAINTSF